MMENENKPAVKNTKLSICLKDNCFTRVSEKDFQLLKRDLFLVMLLVVINRSLKFFRSLKSQVAVGKSFQMMFC